ncbi:hypothetical protein AB0M92_20165 [Streptomyces sp. NPDC051582]|uniref:hypothetical protein n=1 Tax=Streptomyces sp. NPDC051582 TaxID=3155167 RepID=UPI0034393856
MIEHHVRVHPSAGRLPRERRPARKPAESRPSRRKHPALDPAAVVTALDRVVDNTAVTVAVASLTRRPDTYPAADHSRPAGARPFPVVDTEAVAAYDAMLAEGLF